VPGRADLDGRARFGTDTGTGREGLMKGRESGMPDETYWETFFNPS
jgi:hypothetical protein